MTFSCSKKSTPIFSNIWDEDVYYFGENLKENHVDLFFKISKSEFENDINNLRSNTSQFDEPQILIELAKILSKIGDSHTQLEFTHQLSPLPFRVLWLDDGLLLSEVDINHSQHLGKVIIEINDMPIGQIMDQFRSVISYENESNFKNQVINYIRFIEFYKFLGLGESSNEVLFKFEDESKLVLNDTNSTRKAVETTSTPLFLEDTETYYWYEELTDDNLIYIQYNACRERLELPMETFTNQIVNEIDGNNNIDKIVLDFRHNGGGNSAIMKPLIDELENYVSENRFTKDQIYVIIGRKTFSAAVLNTLELKRKLDMKIYGEPSGGKPNHHGEVRYFRMPKSFLKVSYSTKYFEVYPNNDDSIYPDKVVEYDSYHYLNGVDPVLAQIISE